MRLILISHEGIDKKVVLVKLGNHHQLLTKYKNKTREQINVWSDF